MGAGPSNELANKARVNIATEKRAYVPGERIRGYVDLEVMQELSMDAVTVQLVGAAFTQVEYTTHSNEHTHHHTARQTVPVVALEAVVATFPGNVAPPGRRQLPFAFDLPVDAPASIGRVGTGKNHCVFDYKVGVTVARPGFMRKNLVHRVALDVASAPVLNIKRAGPVTDVVELTACCCAYMGATTLTASASADAVAAGDKVAVTFDVANNASSDFENVRVFLRREVKFTARNHKKQHLTTLVELACPGCARGAHVRGKTVSFVVPSTGEAVPSLDVKTITLAYYLEVKAMTSSPLVKNPSVRLPVGVVRRPVSAGHPEEATVLSVSAPAHAGNPPVGVVVATTSSATAGGAIPIAEVVAYEPNPGLQSLSPTPAVGVPVADATSIDDGSYYAK